MFHIAWGALLYDLLRVVDRTLALIAAFLLVVDCALQAVAGLFYLAPVLVLGPGGSLGAFTVDQLQALAFVFLKWNGYAYDIYLAFFGIWLIVTGYLISRSTFLPRIIGVLLMLEGLGWATFLSPPLGSALLPVIIVVAAFGELPLLAWLVIVGVNAERWKDQAAAAGASGAH